MKLMRVIAVAAAVFSFSGLAGAGTVGGGPPGFTLDVTSSVGHDMLHLTPTLTDNGDGSFTASGTETVTGLSILFDFRLNPDPKITGKFTLQNMSGTPQTYTVLATLSGLAPIGGPTSISGYYGPGTATDLNNGSVALSTQLFYQAQIDGTPVKNLGNFMLEQSSGPPPPVIGISVETSQELFGPEAGLPVAGSISVFFPGFSLTAGDQLEVPFEFSVVPEPGFASLFAVMAGIFLARAARKSTRSSNPLW
jgi:hypothetical protein